MSGKKDETRVSLNDTTDEFLFESYFDSSFVGFSVFDDELNYVKANEDVLSNLGMTRDEVIGKHILEVRPKLRDSEFYDKMQNVLATGNGFSELLDTTSIGAKNILLTVFKMESGLGLISIDVTESRKIENRLKYQTAILENLMDAVISTDLNSKILTMNKAAIDLYGYSESEVIGKNVTSILKNQYIGTTRSEVLNTFSKTGYWSGEVHQQTKSGEIIDVYAVLSLIKNDEGIPIGIVAVNRDISDQVRLANQFSMFMNSATDGFLLLDRDMKIQNANQTWLKNAGFTNDAMGKSVYDIFSPELIEKRVQAYHKVIETGEPVEFENVKAVSENDLIYDIQAFKVGDGVGLIVRDVSEKIRIREELRVIEERHSGFMQSATDFFSIFDQDMRFVEVNNSWIKANGYERDEVIGKHILDVYTKLEATGRYDAFMKVLETGIPVNFHGVGTTERGGVVYDISAFKTGDYLGVVAKDVTDREDYHRKIKALYYHSTLLDEAVSINDVYRITYEGIKEAISARYYEVKTIEQDIVSIAYPQDDPFTMSVNGPGITNRAIREKKTQLIYDVRTDSDFLPGTSSDPILSLLTVPIIRAGEVVGLINLESGETNSFDENDREIVETFAFSVSNAITKIEYQERLTSLHAFALAINKLDSFELIAKEAMRLINNIFFNLPVSGFGVVENDIIKVMYSSGAQLPKDLLLPLDGPGISVKAIKTGKTQIVKDVYIDPDFVSVGNREAFKGVSEVVIPIIVQNEGIGVINIESSNLNIIAPDNIQVFELLGEHISSRLTTIQLEQERILSEQEQELNKLKTRFMSTATHEIRTPLASIQGYTELVQDNLETLSESQRQYFEVIQRNVRRLTKLTDDLLNQQRLEEGRIQLNYELVESKELLEEVMNELSPILGIKKQVIECNCPDISLKIDRLRVVQVLINLLTNASKFSPEGSRILINLTGSDASVRIEIEDQGVGIRKEDLDKLFTPFPGILVEGNVSGTGLGLSISKGIVELHGGQIWAMSEGLDKGSKFIFTIPK
jgi:PAS domain S-box-containing protein